MARDVLLAVFFLARDMLAASLFTLSFFCFPPQNVDVDSMESMFTSEGHLVIRAKVKGSENVQERTINISREEPAAGDKEKEPSSDKKKD